MVHVVDLAHKIVDGFEILVYGREPQVGHGVEPRQRAKDGHPYLVCGNLSDSGRAKILFHFLPECRELIGGDGPTLASLGHPFDDFLTAKWLDHPGTLHHCQDHLLQRGELPVTCDADATSTNCGTVLRGT